MTEMELPRTFVERILRDLGTTEGEALCRALDGEACVSIRVNPAKAEGLRGEQPARVSEVLPMLTAAGRVPWCADGFLLAGRPSFTFDSDFHAGAYYVQEAASQFVGCLLQGGPTSGARILDLCAAPGGKTTLYASLVGRGGLVVANEIDRRRASVLADNVRKWGTGNVVVTTCEPHAVCDCEAWFDVVAVDAPCSGEGMFRKDPAARGEWSENNVRQCAARQDNILREAEYFVYRLGSRQDEWMRDKDYVYHYDKRTDVDRNSFRIIGEDWFIDKNYVYLTVYNNKTQAWDLCRIDSLQYPIEPGYCYFRNGRNVIYGDSVIVRDIDIRRFEEIGVGKYLVNDMLFLNGEPFLKDSLDVKNATFYFYGRIATDKHHVFFDRKQLDDINAATFRQISNEVFEDRNYIYTIKENSWKEEYPFDKKRK